MRRRKFPRTLGNGDVPVIPLKNGIIKPNKGSEAMLNRLTGILMNLIYILAFGYCGILVSIYEHIYDIPRGVSVIFSITGIILVYAAMFLQTIIHEAGHLVFGLLSGYKFSSFRILKYTFVKVNGKIKVKKYNIPGTLGQCLMEPPELKNGKIPVVLFNYGGVIFNFSASLLCYGIYYAIGYVSYSDMFLRIMIVVGLCLGLTNGIPMKNKLLSNDVYHIFSMLKNQNALLSMWTQLKINAMLTKGVRIKDMPDEWFYLPDDEAMQNNSEAVMGVFYCSRMVDEGRFLDAGELIEHLLNIKSGITGLHRIQLTLDYMFCEMMTESRKAVIDKLCTKQIAKSMKAMSCFLSTIRTEYAYALLVEKDMAKAELVMKHFEKTAKSYPYPAEIAAEYEFIKLVNEKVKA